jgi:TRAP-type mannitol/chloroaromatic compound transport system permease small subunit
MGTQRLLYGIDAISTWVGKLAAWLIIALMAVVCVEVFKRYYLNAPSAWIFDGENMIYGTLFMLSGAYTARCGRARRPFSTSFCISFSSFPGSRH